MSAPSARYVHESKDDLPPDICYGARVRMKTCRRCVGGCLSGETIAVHSPSAMGMQYCGGPTPALVYDLHKLGTLADVARQARRQSGARVLFAVKACTFPDVLRALAPSLDGFAVSSLFEARLVHELHPGSPVHLTTPGLRTDEIEELADICSFVTFNSETQLYRLGPKVHRYASVGLRVNTQVSRVKDCRYDPARPDSKLGVPLRSLPKVLASAPFEVNGLHFHTNADSEDLGDLETNVEVLAESHTGTSRFAWVNFGGGYLFENVPTFQPLERSVALVKRDLADEVFVEPGAGLVRAAGYLVTTIIDVFQRHDTQIAILDTSVNHLPEVLEFTYQPEIEGSTIDGCYEYLLAGSSCLAGDVFGRYRFDTPLAIGTKVVLIEAGAYAQAKSHRFNGINLPSVWVRTQDGDLVERQSPSYESYLQHWMSNG